MEKGNEKNDREMPISRLIKLANRAIRKEVQEQLKPFNITPTQWSALGIIYLRPGLLPSELQTILLTERSSVTSLVNGLVKRELVYRVDHPDDGRYKKLYLTDKGKELAVQTRDISTVLDKKLGSAYSPEEFKQLKKGLMKMIRTLGKS
ncbi:DNA-binding MarR family transcriptional regulator [Pullulanibacillus pueri]|uniref:Transcriptional regulator n=1 Tax=Pullulanibacillus pueri TaxID=1437324 RepID=A0A8J3EP63_9BACL|nr:MarR family transcriptional regulator [Pullulanibacillus pueri]MBM7683931.1 DNA-binding MarR family transcriptional regulator [Pullulanibacillus pueri]GGH87906.1 transcriptional regulator [Pullulanibacillus pueri]